MNWKVLLTRKQLELREVGIGMKRWILLLEERELEKGRKCEKKVRIYSRSKHYE